MESAVEELALEEACHIDVSDDECEPESTEVVLPIPLDEDLVSECSEDEDVCVAEASVPQHWAEDAARVARAPRDGLLPRCTQFCNCLQLMRCLCVFSCLQAEHAKLAPTLSTLQQRERG